MHTTYRLQIANQKWLFATFKITNKTLIYTLTTVVSSIIYSLYCTTQNVVEVSWIRQTVYLKFHTVDYLDL